MTTWRSIPWRPRVPHRWAPDGRGRETRKAFGFMAHKIGKAENWEMNGCMPRKSMKEPEPVNSTSKLLLPLHPCLHLLSTCSTNRSNSYSSPTTQTPTKLLLVSRAPSAQCLIHISASCEYTLRIRSHVLKDLGWMAKVGPAALPSALGCGSRWRDDL